MRDVLKEDLQAITLYRASPQWGKGDSQSLQKEQKLADSLKDSLYYGSQNDDFIGDALKATNKLAEACDLINSDERKCEIAQSVLQCYALAATCDDKTWSGEEKPINLTAALSNADDALSLCGKEFLQTRASYYISDMSGLALMGDEKTAKALLDLNKTMLQKGMMSNNILQSKKASIATDWYESMAKIALKYPSLAADCVRQVRAVATCDDNRTSATNNGSTFFGVILNDERFSKTDKLLAKSAKVELDNEHFREYGFIPNGKADWQKYIKYIETGKYEPVSNQDGREDKRFNQMEKEYSKSQSKDKRWEEYTKSQSKDKRWEEYTKSTNNKHQTIDIDYGYGR